MEHVTFKCSLEGKPKANVSWWHEDSQIDLSNRGKYTVSGPSSVSNSEASLTIVNLVKGDEGFYSCKAQNALAAVESKRAYLTVYCKSY